MSGKCAGWLSRAVCVGSWLHRAIILGKQPVSRHGECADNQHSDQPYHYSYKHWGDRENGLTRNHRAAEGCVVGDRDGYAPPG